MKYQDEYRDPAAARRLADAIARTVTRPWVLMEVCGGQTHTIVKYGIDHILPPGLELVHGPGCPVCVTSLEIIDRAHAIASRPDVIFCSFGDMLRVPGSRGDLCNSSHKAAMSGSSTRRSTPSTWPRPIRGAQSCSSLSVSRPRPRRTQWPSGWRGGAA